MTSYSLNGSWQMRQVGEENWHQARVPGSVYTDLMAEGILPDPFWRENELEAFQLMRKDFEYRRSFTLGADFLALPHITLKCEGLDTLCRVYLNGSFLFRGDNMHITWEWEVSSLLKEGENTLEMVFESPVEAALAAYDAYPIDGSTDAIPGYSHIRKAHCMYGWDWGPRLPDAGIWRGISLVGWEDGLLESVQVLQEHGDNRVTLRILPELKAGSDPEEGWRVTVTAPDGQTWQKEVPSITQEGVIEIDNPCLWWPAGYGEQPLYRVTVVLLKNGREQDLWEKRIGLRTLTIHREEDQWGEEFCHLVNGVKIFAMGGDYIPEDNLLSRVTPERSRRLLEDAKLAHFNTIRVWGGGYYPDDFFFDICDELGLLVWIDLMYACAYYRLTPAFEQSVTLETEQNVRRMRSHACLALICGNNEMEWQHGGDILQGVAQGFRREKGLELDGDYIKLAEYILPKIVERLAPQTFFWPSSPSNGGSFVEPNDYNRGDTHYWDVWHGEKPFTEYRKFFFRYASEFGFQSFPCLKTVESFTLPEDRNIFSRVMERHQRNKSANGKILSYMSQTYRYPNSFDNLLYCSQLLQADAIRYGVEHWRRNRGRCMGAIIWQLNDCWPVASWASIDYFGRWKAMHYAARRFFAPVMISAEETGEIDQNPHINEFLRTPLRMAARLNVANETREPVSGTVFWALRDPMGKAVKEGSRPVTVPALSSLWLEEEDFTGEDLTRFHLEFRFEQESMILSQGTALFCAPKHYQFADPALTVTLEGDELVVEAKAFAKSVWLESQDPDLLLEDNCFDLEPGIRRIKILRGSGEAPRVRSVWSLDRGE